MECRKSVVKEQLNWREHATQLAEQLWRGKKVPGSDGPHKLKKVITMGGTPKDPKYLIAKAVGRIKVASYWHVENDSHLLAVYPRARDVEKFTSKFDMLTGVPRKYFNGSIGAMHARHHAHLLGFGGKIDIEFLEGTRVAMTPGLTHTLASKYGGWREHLLQWLFNHARKRRVKTIRLRITHDEFDQQRGGRTEQIFRQTAQKHGFEIGEPNKVDGTDYFLVAQKHSGK